MHSTQGTFSYLPELTDEQIARQVSYCLEHGWAISIEHTDDPHPRNIYWELWRLPIFDEEKPEPVLRELNQCRTEFPDDYIKISALDRSKGRQTTALSFLVQRPQPEPSLRLERLDSQDRQLKYSLHPVSANDHRHSEQ
jgi:ribulose-bisphosphate carboxylase small chain